MGDLALVQLWHLHQPPTQEPAWVERAAQRAYGPLLRLYARHGAVRYNANLSGSLIDQLERWAPAVLGAAADAVATGQMEPTTTAYYQPLLPFIPREHALAQIRRNTERIEGIFHRRPRAAWVPERAWEPSLAALFADAGIAAVLLDDHLLVVPRGGGEKYRPWTARAGARGLTVFPIDEAMRYLVPWKPVEEVFHYLEGVADGGGRGPVVTFADDGEKMGLWPGTEAVYPWLEAFLAGIEERPWIRPTTLEAYLAAHGVAGEATFAAGAYREMEEWCLGDLRNWLRHPLVRDMYHRLLLTIAEVPEGWRREEVLRAEGNDPYWYARRMTLHRQEVYRNLLLAERGQAWAPAVRVVDLNGDGQQEALLQDDRQRVFVGADGRIYEWDDREVAHNFVNTGFLDLGYGEEKPLRGPEVFSMARRNCLTDFLDGGLLPGEGPRREGAGVAFRGARGDLAVVKSIALVGGVLEVRYRVENRGPRSAEARLAVELCFTPPTDTVEASLRDYHRHVFDYAGAVIDRPVEVATDGPGVAWASVEDRRQGVVAGAAWPRGSIEAHGRGIAAEGATMTPVFRLVLEPGEAVTVGLRAAVGRGDHRRVAGLLPAGEWRMPGAAHRPP